MGSLLLIFASTVRARGLTRARVFCLSPARPASDSRSRAFCFLRGPSFRRQLGGSLPLPVSPGPALATPVLAPVLSESDGEPAISWRWSVQQG